MSQMCIISHSCHSTKQFFTLLRNFTLLKRNLSTIALVALVIVFVAEVIIHLICYGDCLYYNHYSLKEMSSIMQAQQTLR